MNKWRIVIYWWDTRERKTKPASAVAELPRLEIDGVTAANVLPCQPKLNVCVPKIADSQCHLFNTSVSGDETVSALCITDDEHFQADINPAILEAIFPPT